jgi:hypothetical protein
MDITLQRILSLLEHKQDGDFVHGAKAKFAKSLGFKGGEIVTMWINGSSDSYKNYLYQISSLYDVSVEWLKGEADNPRSPGDIKKERPAENGETLKESFPEDIRQLLSICQENPELASALLSVARQIEKGQAGPGSGGRE